MLPGASSSSAARALASSIGVSFGLAASRSTSLKAADFRLPATRASPKSQKGYTSTVDVFLRRFANVCTKLSTAAARVFQDDADYEPEMTLRLALRLNPAMAVTASSPSPTSAARAAAPLSLCAHALIDQAVLSCADARYSIGPLKPPGASYSGKFTWRGDGGGRNQLRTRTDARYALARR